MRLEVNVAGDGVVRVDEVVMIGKSYGDSGERRGLLKDRKNVVFWGEAWNRVVGGERGRGGGGGGIGGGGRRRGGGECI